MTAHPQAARAERMAAMYRQGLTLETIGQEYGITRERVRQLLKRVGVSRRDGGVAMQAASRRISKDAQKQARELNCLAKWGVSTTERTRLRADGTIRAFEQQRKNAKNRGVAWRLTFAQWWAVWQASGKFGQRARRRDGYCMSRIRDDGPYSVGNVHIQTIAENSREAVKQWRGKKKQHRGVFCLYPGRAKPYRAVACRRSLGFYATAEEAAWARASYLETRECLD